MTNSWTDIKSTDLVVISHSDADPVHVEFFEVAMSRADARALIAAYRELNRAICQRRESGKAELSAIRALYRRLGVRED